jgi:cell division protein FtsI (penicillin-binding protein 3)
MTDWLRRAARARSRMIDPLAGERPDEAFESRWRQSVKKRTALLLGLLGIWAVALEARLLQLQVLDHADLATEARNQQSDVIRPPAVRGDIVDRHGSILAYSVDAAAIVADPAEIKNDGVTAAALCQALGDCAPGEVKELTAKFATDGRHATVRKARAVTPSQTDAVDALGLRGVTLVPETRRWYPRLNLAAHLLGYVGSDNKGLGGIEHKLDSLIRGREGRLHVQFDAKRQRMATRVEEAPTAGSTVELTIDMQLQYIAERELQAAVREHRARGGTVVIMEPFTGEIYAIASYPTFNPNAPGQAPEDHLRNRAVQEVYEPGSTFKIVTASAALEEGILKPTDLIDLSPGFVKLPGGRIVRDEHRQSRATFEDVIVHSSNVGAIKAGARVGAERLSLYIKRFGFGDRLAPDFNGESRGVVFDASALGESALASVSMGYQISVTPLQMAAATSAIANGGLLVEPHLVRATITNGVRQAVEPKVLRRAIAEETAATLTTIMEGVVERGTATGARLERYQVAGKTGTAKKVVNGRYAAGEFNSSFVGFVPSRRRPAFAIVVVIDTPRGGEYYGGRVAAPAFKRIAEAALRQAGVPPTVSPVPPIVVTNADKSVRRPSEVATAVPVLARVGGRAVMPDLRGLSGRHALRILTNAGLTLRVSGDGFVVDQSPEPGASVEPGGSVSVRLSRGSSGGRQ